jgi:hypothetical protein
MTRTLITPLISSMYITTANVSQIYLLPEFPLLWDAQPANQTVFIC